MHEAMRLAYAKLLEATARDQAAHVPGLPDAARLAVNRRKQICWLSEQLERAEMQRQDTLHTLEAHERKQREKYEEQLEQQRGWYEARLQRLGRELEVARTLTDLRGKEVELLRLTEQVNSTPLEDRGIQVDMPIPLGPLPDEVSVGHSQDRVPSAASSRTTLTLRGVDPRRRLLSVRASEGSDSSGRSPRSGASGRALRAPALSSTSLFGPLTLFDLNR